jgi:glucose-1-phosphate thymidylyltransferase long form
MKAVILAGGEGKRLGKLTENLPKPMMPVSGKPLIRRTIDSLVDYGIRDFLLVVGYRKEDIIDYLGDGSQMDINVKYVEQKDRLGSAHAISLARDFVGDNFLLVYGDVVFDDSVIFTLLKKAGKVDCALTSKEVDNPEKYGVLKTKGEKVVGLVEKSPNPPSNLINAGIYLFSKDIFEAIDKTPLSPRGEYEITDSIQYLIDSGKKVVHVPIKGHWIDVGTREKLILASEMFE